jgi:hypothetical protein
LRSWPQQAENAILGFATNLRKGKFMIAALIVLLLLGQSQAPTKIVASVITRQGVPNTPDSIGETNVQDQDVVTCVNADDEKGAGKGVCYLGLPSGRTTLEFKKSAYMRGSGHLKLTCGRKGERQCHIIVIQGFPKKAGEDD